MSGNIFYGLQKKFFLYVKTNKIYEEKKIGCQLLKTAEIKGSLQWHAPRGDL